MVKRMILMLLITFGVIVGLGVYKVALIKKAIAMGKSFAPPPPAVSTLVVKEETWLPVINAVGSLRAVHGVTVSTDLAGIVAKIAFESGTPVKKGDPLVKLDTQEEDAQLRSAQARLDLAKLDLNRKADLMSKKAIPASDVDTAQSEVRRAEASVEETRALIGRKQILSPFDGTIGIRQVNLGQYVEPGAMIATLQSLDPIYVEFSLPQQSLRTVSLGRKLHVKVGGIEKVYEGEITALNSAVDEMTRNITIQGTLANPQNELKPGMFANVEVQLDRADKMLFIPSTAILYSPKGDAVYVLGPGVASPLNPTGQGPQTQLCPVKLGATRGDQIAVVSGIKAGDELIISAVFKLRPGTPVRVNNESPQPSNSPNPNPPNT